MRIRIQNTACLGPDPPDVNFRYESGSEIRTFLTETYVAFKDLLDLRKKGSDGQHVKSMPDPNKGP
jgi:hypothetical protein